ncbi:hypothetical protein CRENPOLYSF2_1500003 [Crenothrix polyspora]|uniref:Transposase DDE domain-containing protein n=1 Tax=Crenothrix polyspora TaxID=360316 RepID=A0A1R4H270_9GAMM|nr:hypothetical protein CRENPOLYSF2_1500003 [Crenothrix polyspora]
MPTIPNMIGFEFGDIVLTPTGFHRFMLRGLDAIQGEWLLVCMAFNLKRLCVLTF